MTQEGFINDRGGGEKEREVTPFPARAPVMRGKPGVRQRWHVWRILK